MHRARQSDAELVTAAPTPGAIIWLVGTDVAEQTEELTWERRHLGTLARCGFCIVLDTGGKVPTSSRPVPEKDHDTTSRDLTTSVPRQRECRTWWPSADCP